MAESTVLREFIPSGACVDPDTLTLESFNRLDSGEGNEHDLSLAKTACDTCVQLTFCQEQRTEIGDELWRRGAHSTVIGGSLADSRRNNIEGGLHEPSLRFELSSMPQTGALKLDLLRQALRSGQLSSISRPPKTIEVFTEKYRTMLQQRDPDVLTQIDSELTDTQRTKALSRIAILLCMQADFGNTKKSFKKGIDNERYNPKRFDFEGNYTTVKQYVEDIVAIKKMGIGNPQAFGLYHSAAQAERILNQFNETAPRSILRQIITNSPRDPVSALVTYTGRVQAARVLNTGSTEHAIRLWARSANDIETLEQKTSRAQDLQSNHPGISLSVAQRALTGANPENILSDIEEKTTRAIAEWGDSHPIVDASVIDHFARQPTSTGEDLQIYHDSYKRLYDTFGNNPDFTNGIIRRFAKGKDPDVEIERYQSRLALSREARQQPDSVIAEVPDSFLREFALARDVIDDVDIAKYHKLKYLKSRFERRDKLKAETGLPTANIERWMIQRVLELYPLDAVDDVSENLYKLMTDGIITPHLSELEILNLPGPYGELEKVCDPKTRYHITFNGNLRAMSPLDRLVLAYDFDLGRLLYGQDLDGIKLATYLGLDSVFGYGANTIYPRFNDHLQQAVSAGTDSTTPLSRFELVGDLDYIRDYATLHETNVRAIRPLPTIIGSRTMSFTEQASAALQAEGALSQRAQKWVESQAHDLYPPSQHESFYRALNAALNKDILRLKTVPGSETHSRPDYTIDFNGDFYLPNISDSDRAAIACVTMTDRIIYRYDLTNLLRSRLYDTDINEHVARVVLPKSASWMRVDEVLTNLGCTESDLQAKLSTLQSENYVWKIDNRIYCINTSLLASLTSV